ncbi:MAG: hypothetical protein KAR38_08810, partial [Calditrichia bacterium]|nr:hypothetical protein [Calditrichia bacterium]
KECNIIFNGYEGIGLFLGIISKPKYNKIYYNNFISNDKVNDEMVSIYSFGSIYIIVSIFYC